MCSAPGAETRRLFLALWPDALDRERMAALTRSLRGGRRVKEANLHLTLAFLGSTPAERWRCYEQSLRGIRPPVLDLVLDRLGWWPRSRILWLGTSQPSAALNACVADLQRRLSACGFTPDRRPFSAHITLARDFPGPAPPAALAEPIVWTIDRIVLVESLTRPDGARYEVLQSGFGD